MVSELTPKSAINPTRPLKTLLPLSFFLTVYLNAFPMPSDTLRTCLAVKTENQILKIDARDDEPQWSQVAPCGEFVQFRPYERARPSQKTDFRVLYDDEFIYFFIRSWDTEPEKIVRRMTRRDDMEGDRIVIQIDSYNDKRTAFQFGITAAGIKSDGVYSEDGNGESDDTWDAVLDDQTLINE